MSNEIYFFCKNVKRLREKYGLSKIKMAKKLDISTYMLSKIENGIIPARLDVSILVKIFKLYNILPSELFSIIL